MYLYNLSGNSDLRGYTDKDLACPSLPVSCAIPEPLCILCNHQMLNMLGSSVGMLKAIRAAARALHYTLPRPADVKPGCTWSSDP